MRPPLPRAAPPRLVLLALLLLPLLLASCGRGPGRHLDPADFSELPGFAQDDPRPALRAFLRGCPAFARMDGDAPVDPLGDPRLGTAGDWRRICERAAAVDPEDPEAVRRFFTAHFRPLAVDDGEDGRGLFTGYYEPELSGSPVPDARFAHPLYARPPDLVDVDLGLFDPELRGRRIAGRVEGTRLVPYFDRAAIDAGALAGRGLELLWVDDPVDAFFLHIQGSGRVRLPDGRVLRVGYAGQNGRPYRAIGRDLVEMGELSREEVSLFSIRAWLEAHPDRARGLLHRNPSYVFFRILGEVRGDEGPPGAMDVPLTPERSIAVDRRYWPLGVPFFVDVPVPFPEGERPWRRLVVAQDTGGAIRGPIRADVFWGWGERAEFTAGHMKHEGRMWVLVPRAVTATVAARGE